MNADFTDVFPTTDFTAFFPHLPSPPGCLLTPGGLRFAPNTVAYMFCTRVSLFKCWFAPLVQNFTSKQDIFRRCQNMHKKSGFRLGHHTLLSSFWLLQSCTLWGWAACSLLAGFQNGLPRIFRISEIWYHQLGPKHASKMRGALRAKLVISNRSAANFFDKLFWNRVNTAGGSLRSKRPNENPKYMRFSALWT